VISPCAGGREDIETEEYLHMRYDRTDCALMVTVAKEESKEKHCRHGDFLKSFEER
jgi:5-oxoprolinase (ATP-hydrolysing)